MKKTFISSTDFFTDTRSHHNSHTCVISRAPFAMLLPVLLLRQRRQWKNAYESRVCDGHGEKVQSAIAASCTRSAFYRITWSPSSHRRALLMTFRPPNVPHIQMQCWPATQIKSVAAITTARAMCPDWSSHRIIWRSGNMSPLQTDSSISSWVQTVSNWMEWRLRRWAKIPVYRQPPTVPFPVAIRVALDFVNRLLR